MAQTPRSVAEIDSFITMLTVACEDASVYARLEQILTLPDAQRKLVLHKLLSHMIEAQAPQDFAAAMACLLDDQVAEKAYEVIFKCKRGLAL